MRTFFFCIIVEYSTKIVTIFRVLVASVLTTAVPFSMKQSCSEPNPHLSKKSNFGFCWLTLAESHMGEKETPPNYLTRRSGKSTFASVTKS